MLDNPRWAVWRLTGAATEPEPRPVQLVSDERLAALRGMAYRDYLRTPEWRRTRAAALERAGHRCSLDRGHQHRLKVHHNTCERIGAELPSDLVVLCHDCHRLHHAANGRPRRQHADPSVNERRRTGSIPPPSALEPTDEQRTQSEPPAAKRSLLRRILAG